MILSMTGYGKASGTHGEKNFTVEIKSLNSKQSDIFVRMPSVYKELELPFRSQIHKQLERGKIEFNLNVESTGIDNVQTINQKAAEEYHKQIVQLSNTLNLETGDVLSNLLKLPEVLQAEKSEIDDEEKQFLQQLTGVALEKLNEFRKNEGEKLHVDFQKRINTILEKLKIVEEHETPRIDAVKDKLTKALKELSDHIDADENRYEQELIYYLEKLDITEEKVRLKAHCEYFNETMSGQKSQGKKLGFILQEIGREINTMGSKANYAQIQRAVVQMKDELEKIKEQMLNVL